MTPADLDPRDRLPTQLIPLTRSRDVLIAWSADIAAKSQAHILGGWLRAAAASGQNQADIDTALQHAREAAVDFADFAILAGRAPDVLAAMCELDLAREYQAAFAMIRAEVVARLSRAQVGA